MIAGGWGVTGGLADFSAFRTAETITLEVSSMKMKSTGSTWRNELSLVLTLCVWRKRRRVSLCDRLINNKKKKQSVIPVGDSRLVRESGWAPSALSVFLQELLVKKKGKKKPLVSTFFFLL